VKAGWAGNEFLRIESEVADDRRCAVDLIQLIGIPVPPMLEAALGYPGELRWVAFWWEQAGDELAWDDGRSSTVMANWYAWLIFVRHPSVEPYLAPYELGSSDTQALHALLLDRKARALYVGRRMEVIRFLADQAPPAPAITIEEFQAYMLEAMAKMTLPNRQEITRRMQEEARLCQELQAWLDRQARQ
jgi:hypothetical protein